MCRGTVLGSLDWLGVRVPNGVSNMPQAYSYYSHYEVLTLALIRERIGRGLRERYPGPKELPPKLWALVVKLDGAESNYGATQEQRLTKRQEPNPEARMIQARATLGLHLALVSSLAADRLLDTAAQSARLAPVGRGQQSLQRSVVQSGGIALAFHRQAQHRARQLVRFHSFVADRLERQPRFVESCL